MVAGKKKKKEGLLLLLNAESRCQRVIKGGCCERYVCVIFPFILPAGKQMFELKKKKKYLFELKGGHFADVGGAVHDLGCRGPR